jgi:xanthosine utilization system XapX-like protein
LNAASNLRLTLLFAATSIVGIIGMLLYEGVVDFIALLLAALPVVFGGIRWWQHR